MRYGNVNEGAMLGFQFSIKAKIVRSESMVILAGITLFVFSAFQAWLAVLPRHALAVSPFCYSRDIIAITVILLHLLCCWNTFSKIVRMWKTKSLKFVIPAFYEESDERGVDII
jgi:hypothetical protein